MIRTIGIVLGVYGVIAFAVALIQLVRQLEDGLVPGAGFEPATSGLQNQRSTS